MAWRDVDVFDNPPLPLPSGGAGNATTYVTNDQIALGGTYTLHGGLMDVGGLMFGWWALRAWWR